ncbi:MAG: radical SAM protein [Deltaproteobacteria bacterium]|jgi:uncharacterized protein|nr:radical SAM protein [Deltaproteobacteria bacterium]
MPYPPISFLVLVLTTRCNLKCGYCYNGDLPPQDMDPLVLTAAFEVAAKGQGPLKVQMTGGEPTLVPELIVAVAEKALKLARPYRLSLQTNATLLDRSLVKTLKKLNVAVGVSLDGPPAVNEALRGQTRAVLAGLSALDEELWPFTTTSVVSAANCQALDQLPLLLGSRPAAVGLGLDLLVAKGRGLALKAPDPQSLANGVGQLGAALDFINARRRTPLRLREERFLAQAALGPKAFCAACEGESLAVTPTGQVYPCGQTAFNEDLALGSIFKGPIKAKPLVGLSLSGPNCQACFLKGRCPGECPSRLYLNQGLEPFLACAMYQALARRLLPKSPK